MSRFPSTSTGIAVHMRGPTATPALVALLASILLAGCVPPSPSPGAYSDNLSLRSKAVVQASGSPVGRPVVYQNSHMPLAGRVPIRSEVVLTPQLDGSFQASVTTGAPNVGSGQVSGTAVRHGSDVVITQPASADGPACTLTMSPVRGRADTMAVTEGPGCSYWHGAGVEFQGAYRRVG